jgi:hypothetical protein
MLPALELSHDVIPTALREAARYGSAAAAEVARARQERTFFRREAHDYAGSIRARRAAGRDAADLLHDFRLYRREFRRLHLIVRAAEQRAGGGDVYPSGRVF